MNNLFSDLLKQNSRQSGQILLIVVLSIVVALTIGLSIASRTISNLRISKQNEESQRAFQAAEAGLERATRQLYTEGITEIPGELGNNAQFNVSIETQSSNQMVLNGGDLVQRAIGLDIWMSDHPDYANPFTGNVTLGFGQPGNECSATGDNYPPALEVLFIEGSLNDPSFRREVYDPCGRIPGAASTNGQQNIAGTQFRYHVNLNVSTGRLLKVIPIYNSTKLGASATSNLPPQGSLITSEGKSGDTVRKLTYFQSFPQIPNELFPYAIISQ